MNRTIVISCFLLISAKSFCQSYERIELIDLVQLFIPDSAFTHKDWLAGAEDDSPISWETEGNDFVDENDFYYHLGSFVRKGKVVVTLNNKPLYFLGKKKETLSWDISIYGPRIGISSLYLTNDLLSHENCFENDCVQSYFEKKGVVIKLLRCDEENMLTGGKRFYEIVIKKHPKIFLTVEFSCGSAGCSGSYIFHFYYPDEEYFLKQDMTNDLCK